MAKLRTKSAIPASLTALDAAWVAPAVRRLAPRPGLESGFEVLDALTGGLRGMIVLGGLRKVGKTTLALQLASEVARRNAVPTLVASYEMSAEQLVPIFRASYSGVPRREVELGALDPAREPEAWKRWTAALTEFGDRLEVRGNNEPLDLDGIGDWVHEAKRRQPTSIPVVVVDSLHALVQARVVAARSEKEGIDYVVCEFKALVGREDCCVLALSHVTKASGGKAEQGAFLGSSGIEHYADSAWILSSESRATGKKVLRQLHVEANRFGPSGRVPLDFQPELSRFQERAR